MVDAHERFVASGPLRIWTERAGEPGLPAVLMVMGSAAQGRSSTVDFEAQPYTIGDMARSCGGDVAGRLAQWLGGTRRTGSGP